MVVNNPFIRPALSLVRTCPMKRSNDMSEPAAGSCLDDESFTILLVQAMGSQRQGSHHTNSLENGDTVDG